MTWLPGRAGLRLLIWVLIDGSLDNFQLGLQGLDFITVSLILLVELVEARAQALHF